MKKRILSVLLCLCMVCMLLPTTALATDLGHDGHTCGESCTHHANDPHRTVITENWKAWTNTVAASQNGSGKTASNSLPNTAGNYYLTKDVELSGTWEPADGVVLCLNGKTITDGKLVITSDMIGGNNVLSATGDITIDAGEAPAPVEKDDSGMGITDYLLIVLVVLAAILVVIVAIRMMRS